MRHRGQRVIDEAAAIVERPDLDAGRQLLLDIGDRILDAGDNSAGVLAKLHQGDAHDGFAFAVMRDCAKADLGRLDHAAHIADRDRRPVRTRGHHDGLDVVDALDQPQSANDLLLIVALQISTTFCGVVGRQRGIDLRKGQVEAAQRVVGDLHLECRHLAAIDVDVRDTRHEFQLR